MRNKLSKILVIVGFLVCVSPIVFNFFMSREQKGVIATYEKTVKKDDTTFEDMKEDAVKYNDMLFQTGGNAVDDISEKILSDNNYKKVLDITESGVMGSLEIPKIGVNLPIYHGTSDESLASGLGHLQGTSFPVGGENTHCVVSGHRGLPSSKLLVRLDEINKNDLFYVKVGTDVLAYKVTDVVVVDPDDVSTLTIKESEDLFSIVTCTPYGINTNRLIVTGTRVPYKESELNDIKVAMPSVREILFTCVPFALFIIIIVINLIRKGRPINENEKI